MKYQFNYSYIQLFKGTWGGWFEWFPDKTKRFKAGNISFLTCLDAIEDIMHI